MLSLPISLTLVRIALSPIFLLLYLYYEQLGIAFGALPYLLLVLVAIAELSDFFDGVLARRNNQVTELGKLLDPMADSIFRLSVFFTFTQGAIQLPMLLILILFMRDSLISTLRTICALRGVALAARFSGKVKALLQASTIVYVLVLMLFYSVGNIDLPVLQSFSFYGVLIVACYTIYSGVEYVLANRFFIRKAISP